MLTLIALVVAGFAVLKAAERWATPLVARYRPQGIIDPSSAGIAEDAGGAEASGLGGGC